MKIFEHGERISGEDVKGLIEKYGISLVTDYKAESTAPRYEGLLENIKDEDIYIIEHDYPYDCFLTKEEYDGIIIFIDERGTFTSNWRIAL